MRTFVNKHKPGQQFQPAHATASDRIFSSQHHAVRSILNLSRTIDNPPAMLQTKLTVGSPGDRYEQEADRVADQVMRMSQSGIQYAYADSNELNQNNELSQAGHALENNLEGYTLSPVVHEALHSSSQPLDPVTQKTFGQRFGYDFSNVRVHTNEKAAASADALNASAYTVRNHIVFGSGWQPSYYGAGGHLLAHELTHVIQQDGTNARQDGDTPKTSQSGLQNSEPRVQRRFAGRLRRFLSTVEARVAGLAQQELSEGSYPGLSVPIRHDIGPTGPVQILGVPFALYRNYYGFELIHYNAAANEVVLDLRGTWYVLNDVPFLHLFDPERGELRRAYEARIPRRITEEVEAPGHLSTRQAERVRHAIDAINLLPRWRSGYGDDLAQLLRQGRIFAGRQQAAVGGSVPLEPLDEWDPEWIPLSASDLVAPAPAPSGIRQIQRGLTVEDAIILDFEVLTSDWRRDQDSTTGVGATLVHEYEHMRRGGLHLESTVEGVEQQYIEDMIQLRTQLIRATRPARSGTPTDTYTGSWSARISGVSYTLHRYGMNEWFITSP